MKKLFISTSIAASFLLAGCGSGDDLLKEQAEAETQRPPSRIVFDPTAGDLPLPTDLLFALAEQTDDGTLEVPDEIAGQANGGTPDFGSPSVALGALDGWSTQHPFSISINHPEGVTLDPASAASPGSIRIFEGAIGGDLNDPDCTTAPPLTGCKVGEELVFGVDFITQAVGDNIAVVPLKPLKGSTSYYVVVTDMLKADDGQSVQESTTYGLVSQPISTLPLATESQLALQGLVNSYEAVLTSQGNVSADSIIFSYTFTTQSTTGIIGTVKQLQIGSFAAAVGAGMDPVTAAQFLPVIAVNESPIATTAFDLLGPTLLGSDQFAQLSAVGLGSCAGMIAAVTNPDSPLNGTASAVFPQVAQFCAASMKQGTIDLPYYLSTTDPLTESWSAACTNGLALQTIGAEQIGALLAAGTITAGVNNDLCQAASGGTLLDLDLTNLGVTDLRHVTRYSPIPARKGSNPDGTETLTVQVTVPDPAVVGLLASIPGSGVQAITKPEGGWPIVILQHGITSKKEDFLAITGALSLAGFATVAIDHPLHGSRGFVIDGQIVNTSGGFGGSVTDYFNLAYLLTSRDNARQSIVDTMGLRLGLNAVVDLTGGSVDLDSTNVSLIGQSLGSITGIPTVAMSNASLGGQLAAFDPMYSFTSAVFSVPGGGTAGMLMESPGFAPLIKGSLLAAASAEFQTFLVEFATANGIPPEDALVPAYIAFEAVLSENPAQLAEVNTLFAEFTFAAQTISDASDPNNFAALLGSNSKVLMHEVVGGGQNDDGSTALSDQTIPNNTVNSASFAGTDPLARFIGLEKVSSTSQGNGLVRFISGGHSSLLNPGISFAATAEMQRQAAAFVATGGTTIVVTDPSVVEN
jgi:Pla-1/cef family extracellular lipase